MIASPGLSRHPTVLLFCPGTKRPEFSRRARRQRRGRSPPPFPPSFHEVSRALSRPKSRCDPCLSRTPVLDHLVTMRQIAPLFRVLRDSSPPCPSMGPKSAPYRPPRRTRDGCHPTRKLSRELRTRFDAP